jgi:hypothetical protein
MDRTVKEQRLRTKNVNAKKVNTNLRQKPRRVGLAKTY